MYLRPALVALTPIALFCFGAPATAHEDIDPSSSSSSSSSSTGGFRCQAKAKQTKTVTVTTKGTENVTKNSKNTKGSKKCKLPKMKSKSAGKPYWVQTGQVMTMFDKNEILRKTYTNEGPTIMEKGQYAVQCAEKGYVPDESCYYTCIEVNSIQLHIVKLVTKTYVSRFVRRRSLSSAH